MAGEIVRILAQGFVVKLTMSTRATEKFARRLNSSPEDPQSQHFPERRHEPRVEPEGEPPVVSLDGTIDEIANLSVTGAEIRLSPRPAIGALVQLGRMRGKVVRHTPHGVGIEFIDVRADATLSGRLREIGLVEKRRLDRGPGRQSAALKYSG